MAQVSPEHWKHFEISNRNYPTILGDGSWAMICGAARPLVRLPLDWRFWTQIIAVNGRAAAQTD